MYVTAMDFKSTAFTTFDVLWPFTLTINHVIDSCPMYSFSSSSDFTHSNNNTIVETKSGKGSGQGKVGIFFEQVHLYIHNIKQRQGQARKRYTGMLSNAQLREHNRFWFWDYETGFGKGQVRDLAIAI